MLHALYTDATNAMLDHPAGRAASALFGGRLERLRARSIPPIIPDEKVHSYPRYNVQQELSDVLRSDGRAAVNDRWGVGSHGLARKLVSDNFGGANALYVHACNGTEAIRAAKRRGHFVVLEAVSMPYHKYTEQEEYERHGASHPDSPDEIEENIDFFRDEAQMADLVVAASSYVEEGLHRLGVPTEATAVVPYGIEESFYNRKPTPIPGRVLFVGHVNRLKGVPYLAKAARLLAERSVDCDVRVVGNHRSATIDDPDFAGPTYVGPVSREAVREEFLNADVFVFPTLSDGFGIVLAEAAAAGLPIISTSHCGDVVRDGTNGFIVPIRDPEAIADRVEAILGDRNLRSQMGQASRQRFEEHFTIERYTHQLSKAIRSRYRSL
jgi:glycosyltransferase involved in cell wall biosynthesis